MQNENYTQIIQRLEKLEKRVFASDASKRHPTPDNKIFEEVDFSINERAFVKRFVADKSGPKRFTLILAYLAKGEVNSIVELSEIKKQWNKMTSKNMLGTFNMFYPNDAKTRGWIDSKEHGTYQLTKEWKEVL